MIRCSSGTGARGTRYFCADPVRLGRSTDQSQAQQPHIGISVTIRAPKTTAPGDAARIAKEKAEDVHFKGSEGLFNVARCHIHGGSPQGCSGWEGGSAQNLDPAADRLLYPLQRLSE